MDVARRKVVLDYPFDCKCDLIGKVGDGGGWWWRWGWSWWCSCKKVKNGGWDGERWWDFEEKEKSSMVMIQISAVVVRSLVIQEWQMVVARTMIPQFYFGLLLDYSPPLRAYQIKFYCVGLISNTFVYFTGLNNINNWKK